MDQIDLSKEEKEFRNFFDILHETHIMKVFNQCVITSCTLLESMEIPSHLKDRFFFHILMMANSHMKDAIFSSEEDITEITTRVHQKFDHLNEKRKK